MEDFAAKGSLDNKNQSTYRRVVRVGKTHETVCLGCLEPECIKSYALGRVLKKLSALVESWITCGDLIAAPAHD